MLHLVDAAEMTRILVNQSQDLVEQIGVGEDRPAAEIDEPLVGAVALRPPAVLVDQHPRIDPPALVLALQAPQHAQEAAEQGRDRQRILQCRAAVGDAKLEGREALARPQVPP